MSTSLRLLLIIIIILVVVVVFLFRLLDALRLRRVAHADAVVDDLAAALALGARM
jgi:hypothetical protein